MENLTFMVSVPEDVILTLSDLLGLNPNDKEQVIKELFFITNEGRAEIRQIAIEAAYNDADLIAAKAMVIPLSKSQKTQMEALEEWAKGRTVPATMPKAKTKKLREISL